MSEACTSQLGDVIVDSMLNTHRLDYTVLAFKDGVDVPEDRCCTPPRGRVVSSVPSTPGLTPRRFQSPFGDHSPYKQKLGQLSSGAVERALRDSRLGSPCLSPRFSLNAFQQKDAAVSNEATERSPRFTPCTPRKGARAFRFDTEDEESVVLSPKLTQNLKTCATPRLQSPTNGNSNDRLNLRTAAAATALNAKQHSKQRLNNNNNLMGSSQLVADLDEQLRPKTSAKFQEAPDLQRQCASKQAAALLPQLPDEVSELPMELEEQELQLETGASELSERNTVFVKADANQGVEHAVFHGEIPSKKSMRVMNAPGLQNDFYTNTIDWSSEDVLAAALESQLYLWDVASDDVTEFPLEDQAVITSVKFDGTGARIAVAFESGDVHVYCVHTHTLELNLSVCSSRIGCLVWTNGMQCAGTKHGQVVCIDAETGKTVRTLDLGSGEICSLAANAFETSLAVGCNDNLACIVRWSDPSTVLTLPHLAAVKGLAWNPSKDDELATGGGSGDRYLRVWSVGSKRQLREVNTQSQVSSIMWHKNELVTAHGFTSYSLVKYNATTLQPIERYTGHLARILSTCSNANKTRICSAGADDTLRIWQINEEPTRAHTTPKNKTILSSPIKYSMR